MKHREANIHMAVAGFLRSNYPDVIFRTDFAAGVKMTMGQAVRHKRLQSGRAYPDLFIAQPNRRGNQVACGLFLELKSEGTRVYLKNGELTADKHIREQAEVLAQLDKLGYRAKFAVGFDEAITLIKQYLGGANDNEKTNQAF